jgi:signal transduction histidine kinase
LLNLVGNAVNALDAMPVGRRRITVSARQQAGRIEVGIADSGPGIAPSVAEHLFEPLFTTKPEGMGMGLNICRSVIEAHQGRLWYEPDRDGGSIFHISLAVHSQ